MSKHPLYEIRDMANHLERDIIALKPGDYEALLNKTLVLTGLVRGLTSVAIANLETESKPAKMRHGERFEIVSRPDDDTHEIAITDTTSGESRVFTDTSINWKAARIWMAQLELRSAENEPIKTK